MGWWKLDIKKDKPGPKDSMGVIYPSNADFEYIAEQIKKHYTSGNLPEKDTPKDN